MHLSSRILLLVTISTFCLALPVTKPKEDAKPTGVQLDNILEYERYLKEVVEALEADPEFRKKLDKAPEADIRNGKIAQELEYVSHQVRSKLDEIKRREIERLRSLANRQYDLTNHIDRHPADSARHLDHSNELTFEIDDLRKLILQVSDDLAKADQNRREEFKQYEMQKEFEKQSIMKEMDKEQREKYEAELQKQKEKHRNHPKVHHPGNKAQLEEVWEEQDHMDKQDFDPKTFFAMHDLDSNGFWDENEVKALFIKELDKVYQNGVPEDDMRERAEEMERMREHVFKETDTNRDGLISFQEFIDQTKKEEFQADPGWDTLENNPQYTQKEYLEFERRRQEEVQRMIQQGLLPPHPNMPYGYYPYPAPPNQYQPHQVNGQQAPLHFQGQTPDQYHPESLQQYQQQQYQQQQQHHQQHPGQQVYLHPNQAYEHVPQQQPQQQQYHPAQQYAPAPQQQHSAPPQQQYHSGQQNQQYHPQAPPQQHSAPPQQQQSAHVNPPAISAQAGQQQPSAVQTQPSGNQPAAPNQQALPVQQPNSIQQPVAQPQHQPQQQQPQHVPPAASVPNPSATNH